MPLIIGLLFLLLYILNNKEGVLLPLICAISIWGSTLFIITEVLSLFNGISRISILISWILVIMIVLMVMVSIKRKTKSSFPKELKILFNSGRALLKADWFSCAVLVFAVVMCVGALLTTPYNYDSMTYHLARIFHWSQNGSVAHYATHIDRQVASPVFDEFVLLHSFVVFDGDRFFNLLQCLSFLFNGILVYEISRKLGVPKVWCRVGSLLFYSAPICFSESLTTQTDEFGAMWTLMFIFTLIDYFDEEYQRTFPKDSMEVLRFVCLGMMVGLGYLVKPNVCIPMFFFALGLLLFNIFKRNKLLPIIKMGLVAIPSFIVLVIPETIRNFASFGGISSSEAGSKQIVGTTNIRYLIVNFSKDFTFNLPNRLLPVIRDWVYRFVIKLANALNVVNDAPSISEDCREFTVPENTAYACDNATFPLVFWLFLFCIILSLVFLRKRKNKSFGEWYFGLAAISMIFLCIILKWEPFISRYMIPFIGTLVPGMMYILSKFFNKGRAQIACISILSFLACATLVDLGIYSRQFVFGPSRIEGYFHYQESAYASYDAWASYINGHEVDKVGLITGSNVFEYPLDVMINDGVEIRHVNVTNELSKYEDESFIPDVIVYIDDAKPLAILESHGKLYHIVSDSSSSIGTLYNLGAI